MYEEDNENESDESKDSNLTTKQFVISPDTIKVNYLVIRDIKSFRKRLKITLNPIRIRLSH